MRRDWGALHAYTELEVPPTASIAEFKAAFRRLSKQHHPDMGGSHEKQIRLNQAYEILTDPVSRVAHDAYWEMRAAASAQTAKRAAPNRPEPESSKPPPREPPGDPPQRTVQPSLRTRILEQIHSETQRIESAAFERSTTLLTNYLRALRQTRFQLLWTSMMSLALVGARTVVDTPWVLAGAGAVVIFGVIPAIKGPSLGNKRRGTLRLHTRWAREQSATAAKDEAAFQVAQLNQYLDDFASLVQHLQQQSTLGDSEALVAQRLSAAFFLLGYLPLSFMSRTIVFTDGEERVVVRFRHRTGAPANVTVAKELVQTMRGAKASRGFLFCSPGLSDNANAFANENGIHAYSLEEMNDWVQRTLTSNYSGPSGDVFAAFKTLRAFLSTLTRRLPEPGIRRRRS